MNDPQIRSALIADLRAADPDIAVFEEMPLCRGDGRADIAVVNGAICGYEIKGSGDSPRRLPKQVADYDLIFDYCTIVTTINHLKRVREIVPPHWGIAVASEVYTGIIIKHKRQAKRNRKRNPSAIMRLLWKREATKMLKNCGIPTPSGTLIADIWDAIIANVPPKVIANEVRLALKARGGSACPVP